MATVISASSHFDSLMLLAFLNEPAVLSPTAVMAPPSHVDTAPVALLPAQVAALAASAKAKRRRAMQAREARNLAGHNSNGTWYRTVIRQSDIVELRTARVRGEERRAGALHDWEDAEEAVSL